MRAHFRPGAVPSARRRSPPPFPLFFPPSRKPAANCRFLRSLSMVTTEDRTTIPGRDALPVVYGDCDRQRLCRRTPAPVNRLPLADALDEVGPRAQYSFL